MQAAVRGCGGGPKGSKIRVQDNVTDVLFFVNSFLKECARLSGKHRFPALQNTAPERTNGVSRSRISATCITFRGSQM
jgi:hypothetical protein